MRYLALSSLLFLACCSSPYRHLATSETTNSALRFKPEFGKVLYRCVVDGRVVFRKFHLSGLLFFKDMHNGSTRIVFQNEMGFTFFDFEWNQQDSFIVHQMIPQLSKPAVVKTLRKDMAMLLMKDIDSSTEISFKGNDEWYHRFEMGNGFAYYIVENNQLVRIEQAGKQKVTTLTLQGKEGDQAMPSSVLVDHHKAHFTISLKKIENAED